MGSSVRIGLRQPQARELVKSAAAETYMFDDVRVWSMRFKGAGKILAKPAKVNRKMGLWCGGTK